MNTIPEEAGKVATSAIESFRNNPACLAVLLLSAFFGALTFYAYQLDAGRRSKTVDTLLERCYPALEDSRANHHPRVEP